MNSFKIMTSLVLKSYFSSNMLKAEIIFEKNIYDIYYFH